MTEIDVKALSKHYGNVKALDGLSLQIEQGEIVALLGVNGAGKTTAIKLLSCLTVPDGGDAWLGGYSIREEAARVKEITNVSPQESAVAKKLTVAENLQLIAEIYGADRKNACERVETMMEKLGLSEVRNRHAGTLSGGWQRRLSIAMALISEPRILFLDEPTLGLDVIARHELWSLIRALKGSVTMLLTTHYLEEAEQLCDRIAILSKGKLVTVGTANEIKAMAGTDRFEDAFVRLCAGEVPQ